MTSPHAKSLTREEFIKATGGPPHHYETHHSWGAICYWEKDGKVYEEHQPDIGKCRWFETSEHDQRTSFTPITEGEAEEIKERFRLDHSSIYAT